MRLLVILILFVSIVGQTEAKESDPDYNWFRVSITGTNQVFKIPTSNLKVSSSNPSNGYEEFYSASQKNERFWIITARRFESSPVPFILNFSSAYEPACSAQSVRRIPSFRCVFVEDTRLQHAFRIIETPSKVIVLYAVSEKDDLDTIGEFINPYNRRRSGSASRSVPFALVSKGLSSRKAPQEAFRKRQQPGNSVFEFQTSVRVRIKIAPNGKVVETRPLDFPPFGLVRSARKSARAMSFRPIVSSGKLSVRYRTLVFGYRIYQ